jgi:hypothetical protein
MNFNVYIDKRTVDRLQRLARIRRTTRNALVREAVARLLERDATAGWPDLVLGFEGVPGARRFEMSRRRLKRPLADPLA